MADYYYQTLQLPTPSMTSAGPSAGAQAVGAGVKLLHKVSTALNGWAVSYRVNRELENLAPEIDKQMPQSGGVLICVGIQEWAIPDATGTRAQMFLSIHIAGAGQSPQVVLEQYLMRPRMVAGAPTGWRRRDEYIWVTPKGKQSMMSGSRR